MTTESWPDKMYFDPTGVHEYIIRTDDEEPGDFCYIRSDIVDDIRVERDQYAERYGTLRSWIIGIAAGGTSASFWTINEWVTEWDASSGKTLTAFLYDKLDEEINAIIAEKI